MRSLVGKTLPGAQSQTARASPDRTLGRESTARCPAREAVVSPSAGVSAADPVDLRSRPLFAVACRSAAADPVDPRGAASDAVDPGSAALDAADPTPLSVAPSPPSSSQPVRARARRTASRPRARHSRKRSTSSSCSDRAPQTGHIASRRLYGARLVNSLRIWVRRSSSFAPALCASIQCQSGWRDCLASLICLDNRAATR